MTLINAPCLLTVGVSTTTDRLKNLSLSDFPLTSGVEYLFIVQNLNQDQTVQNNLVDLQRADVTIVFTDGVGISRSRNDVISRCHQGILWIADDDLRFSSKGLHALIDAFNINLDAAVLTFQSCEANGLLRKNYSAKPHILAKWNSAGVSSFEIAVRPSLIRDTQISFDTLFGIGGQYPFGEEFVFISDCLDAGLNCRYEPFVLATHPEKSTGFRKIPGRMAAQWAIFLRVFGFWAPIWFIAFHIKTLIRFNVRTIQSQLNFKKRP